MNLIRISAIFRKEFIQIMRDPRSLGMAIALPVLLLILFGYALTLDVDNVPLAVWDQDKSRISYDFILNFRNSRYFKIIGYFDNYHELEALIDKNEALMALIIPKDFSKYIQSDAPSPVQLLVDGSNSNTATIAIAYVESIVSRYNMNFILETFSKYGLRNSPAIDVRPRIWFNEELKSRNFIVPGLIAVIMMTISALLTSLTIAREWERGTMEQLVSTPVKPLELILGKFIPYFVIGAVDLLIVTGMAQFVFRVPFRGSFALLLLLSSIFLSGALSLGILISANSRSQLMASQLAILATFLPSILLSGFGFAIQNMPQAVRMFAHIIPATYFIIILKGIYLKGVGLKILWMQAVLLFVFAVIVSIAAAKRFKKYV